MDDNDPELDAIRQKRLAELQAQAAKQGGGKPGANYQDEERMREIEERRNYILQQILLPEAKDRLTRIAMVKPEKARQVEDVLINAAQTGQLSSKVDEQKLISLLGQISEQKAKTTVKFTRRAVDDDE
eukprot:TRINITY_DN4936_c0_g3_i2.p1 TRINITY_DN4936_c0_g3~~TRINITY_DN4936_c0_g3_i2.p1  ORF type:complete len:146 (+),score=48.98 TRINITY_DN4936_c0_g3_i2:55-438(+)